MRQINWSLTTLDLNRSGYAILPRLVNTEDCKKLAALYEDPAAKFRSTIDMARYNFGKGEYKYFDYPLPPQVALLRTLLYPPLAVIANAWSDTLVSGTKWPSTHEDMINTCTLAGQTRPTPLLLHYGPGDFNCLHQDLYGEVFFPLQLIVMLSDPMKDFTGGELILVEQRPRMQSRPIVVPLNQGDGAIIPVRERPRQGKSRFHRVQMRHGVSEVHSGTRQTLGIIFHDAK